MPPVQPMLAKLARELPEGDLLYEPKWDGFRCIVFRDGDEVELGSRNERPLTRYFPELVEPLRRQLPDAVRARRRDRHRQPDGSTSTRCCSASTRPSRACDKLAEETPASFVAFDLLALGDDDLRAEPFAERRALLEEALAGAQPPVHLTPATDRPGRGARTGSTRFEGAGLDGVVAKPLDLPYREDKRVHDQGQARAHRRLRRRRVPLAQERRRSSARCCSGSTTTTARLHHVGVTASFTMARRKELVDELAPYRDDALDGHPWAGVGRVRGRGRRPAASPARGNRWNAKQGPVAGSRCAPSSCVEVAYDHLQGDRFRHATTFRRWRPDRDPASCTYAPARRCRARTSWPTSSAPPDRGRRSIETSQSQPRPHDAGPVALRDAARR